MENMEMTLMNLIVTAGDARSCAMLALEHAREGNFDLANEQLEAADAQLAEAHHTQTDLIQQEAQGNKVPVSLFLIHAQDHLMNAMTVRDLATEIVAMYQRTSA